MAEIEDLNVVAASNTARQPEGQAASTVNDGIRELESMIARFHEDLGARKSSTGSGNSYIFAAAQTITAYYDGLLIGFDANFANTDAADIDVDSLGAKTIKKNGGADDLAAGDIIVGQKVLLVYDGTNFQMLSPMVEAWRIIESKSISATSSLSLTGLTSTYRAYKLIFDDLLPVSDAVAIYVRTDSDGGASYDSGASDYAWALLAFKTGGDPTADSNSDSADSQIQLSGNVGNVANAEEVAGEITIHNPGGTGGHHLLTWQLTHDDSNGAYKTVTGGGKRESTTAVDAIQIFFSSGNIATMNYTLYGLRAS